MPELQVDVRPAQQADIERIYQMHEQARRSVLQLGHEDLLRAIQRDYCFVAETGPLLWGFVCAAVRQTGLCSIRGLGLIDGWQADTGLGHLLQPLERELRRDGVQHIMHIASEPWATSALGRHEFLLTDYILNFERAVPVRPQVPLYQQPVAQLRPPGVHEIDDVHRLDNRAFPWPWQLGRGELVQLVMTSARIVVLDYQRTLAGYACTDLSGDTAHLVRLAVDPAYRRMGWARHLLADALDFAAAAGARVMTLNTQWQNHASQRLYQGFGFRLLGPRIPVMLKALEG